jgi:hypothetical protein
MGIRAQIGSTQPVSEPANGIGERHRLRFLPQAAEALRGAAPGLQQRTYGLPSQKQGNDGGSNDTECAFSQALSPDANGHTPVTPGIRKVSNTMLQSRLME